MSMKAEVVPLKASHVLDIVARNFADGFRLRPTMTADDMIAAYFLPGSAAYCVLIYGVSVFAAGIINLQWHRGEAWVLHSSLFYKYRLTCFRTLKSMLPQIAKQHEFRRVQATSFFGNGTLLRHLGFEKEANLRCYGPEGEDAALYVRIF
jgi:hypothetical protein